ncbi:MAG TPA: protein tyrosine phosphatase family protein [Stenomitos sp.]
MAALDPLVVLKDYRRLSETVCTSGQPTQMQLQQVASQGIEVVINLGLAEADYALPNEGAWVESLGLTYVHLPVRWETPTIEAFQQFIDTLQTYPTQSKLIHCAANKRVSVFMALYRIVVEGWSQAEAIADLHQMWVPDATWQAFIDQVLAQPRSV